MINHRNDVKMCKTQMEPLATGKWLKIVFYFFTITLTVLRSFPEKFLGQSGPGEREKQIFPSSHHLPGLSLTIALHQLVSLAAVFWGSVAWHSKHGCEGDYSPIRAWKKCSVIIKIQIENCYYSGANKASLALDKGYILIWSTCFIRNTSIYRILHFY